MTTVTTLTTRSTTRRPGPRRLAVLTGLAVALAGCGVTPDTPQEDGTPDVRGGAVGPEAQVNDDVNVKQVQLGYPLDGVYEEGEDAPLYMAITNTGTEAVTVTDISGPEFSSVDVVGADGAGLPLEIGPDSNLYFGAEGGPDVVLVDLQTSLRSSQSIPVTVTFADAGEVTVDAMVSAEEDPAVPPYDFPVEDPSVQPAD